MARPPPSIARRLGRSLLASALLWSLAVSAAVGLAVRFEIGELLDETLQDLAAELAPLLPAELPAGLPAAALARGAAGDQIAWQIVRHAPDGSAQVLLASAHAPLATWHATPTAGLSDVEGWRVHGHALGLDARMLYVAQPAAERDEEALEVVFGAALAALTVTLLAQLWLRRRVVQELEPLQRLSERLERVDLLATDASLGAAERAELQPVHAAIDALAEQLRRRVAHERAFGAHAAHALRTPLAGIDAQLAVAQREAPESLQPRLARVRAASGRLQRVVAALLAMFRSGVELRREPVDLHALLARLPTEGLTIEVASGQPLSADADLLVAALANLLDNALRHGAHKVWITPFDEQGLRVADDGPGVPEERRVALQRALDRQHYDGSTGLGLMLADMVARAHGGALRLPPSEQGFVVELQLAAGSAIA